MVCRFATPIFSRLSNTIHLYWIGSRRNRRTGLAKWRSIYTTVSNSPMMPRTSGAHLRTFETSWRRNIDAFHGWTEWGDRCMRLSTAILRLLTLWRGSIAGSILKCRFWPRRGATPISRFLPCLISLRCPGSTPFTSVAVHCMNGAHTVLDRICTLGIFRPSLFCSPGHLFSTGTALGTGCYYHELKTAFLRPTGRRHSIGSRTGAGRALEYEVSRNGFSSSSIATDSFPLTNPQ